MATTSSKPTDHYWDWDPSLLSCDTLPSPRHDLGSLISDTTSIIETGTEFYDRSVTSRRYALVGMVCSGVVSCCCIIAGIFIMATDKEGGMMAEITVILSSNLQKEMITLGLNLIVTLCTESTGFVHGISLRSALASESRLRFNSNLRLLNAARGWRNPNGALSNGIMAILLIISYSSASLVTLTESWMEIIGSSDNGYEVDQIFTVYSTSILGLPLLLLGVALFLQVVIAWSAIRAVKILTWSSSAFDLTAALVHHTQLIPVPFRCMRAVSNLDVHGGPAKPSDKQPSAWHAHPSIRKVIRSLWGLVLACAVWATLAMYFYNKYKSSSSSMITLKSWSFFPSNQFSYAAIYGMPLSGNGPWWILYLANVAVFQGPLTLGLHCSELIVDVIRDERHWRCASGTKGLKSTTNPLKSVFANPLCLILFVVKPVLHWMFGLAFTTYPGLYLGTRGIAFYMYTIQIWNLCIVLLIFACCCTLVSLRRPHGPQPAAYGHLQTLANLVDEWSPVMWWGHKEDGIPYCHAGTSDHSLPAVKMDCIYAGSGSNR
ncbi:hypothetical protein DFJ58DRAFT_722265 [Suillus subalutaceus]|uniref:uncharacterized protein n=1 Tax=Suillus subalutaceus TaxID=48586 RepID=UPI001B863D98|nr:uncharacterized protein DFJ58DRAFT_722265 [Suillus subalutaceus]KAG1872329.1 hypothetical protein DFJ58DRAFT_722265 [Suillus subalutaceus]